MTYNTWNSKQVSIIFYPDDLDTYGFHMVSVKWCDKIFI